MSYQEAHFYMLHSSEKKQPIIELLHKFLVYME